MKEESPVNPVINSVPVTDPFAELLGNWASELNLWSVLLRIVLSLLLSAVIGWERSTKRHSAGLRTFMLVSMTGTLAALLDCFAMSGSSVRLMLLCAAMVIGGAIISIHSVFYSSRNQIRGLTTAVGLWTVGLIGMALGMGFYTVGLIAFLTVLCVLLWFPPLEAVFKNRSNHFEIHLELTNDTSLQDFVTVIRKLGLTIDEIEQNPAYVGSGLFVYSISISVSSRILKKYKSHAEIIEALGSLSYVRHIEEMVG